MGRRDEVGLGDDEAAVGELDADGVAVVERALVGVEAGPRGRSGHIDEGAVDEGAGIGHDAGEDLAGDRAATMIAEPGDAPSDRSADDERPDLGAEERSVDEERGPISGRRGGRVDTGALYLDAAAAVDSARARALQCRDGDGDESSERECLAGGDRVRDR